MSTHSTDSYLPADATGIAPSQDSPSSTQINAELTRTGWRLGFADAGLEAGFRQFMETYNLLQVRLALLVLIVLIGLFGLTDLSNFPPDIALRTLALRLGLIVPFLAWTYWRTGQPRNDAPLHPYLVAAAAISGVGGILLIYLPHSAGLHTPYEGLMLFMFGIGGFMGLRWIYAATLLSLMSLLYVAIELLVAMPTAYLVNSAFRIVCTAMVGSVAAYMVERQARQVYLHRVLLARHAHRDGLTGLANKRALDTHAAQALQQAAREDKPVSVMLIDADYFKQYNDTYGHLMGDQCLKQLATAIAHSARRPLDLAARYGGEEFVLVLFDVGVAESQRLAAQLQARIHGLALPHTGSPGAGRVSVSGGMATQLAGDRQTLQTLLQEADQALYQAKALGRDRFIHFTDMAIAPA